MNNFEFCADWISQLLARESRVLDYGCGAGTMVELLRSRDFDAFGCDLFYDGGSLEKVVAETLIAQGIVRKMTSKNIPFDDSSFDLVVSNQVFEHVEDLDLALSEISRVLRPSGRMLAVFPHLGTWREGHCGIPFLHWFPKHGSTRLWYAAALRSLGLGYFKGDKTILEWSRNACKWLDDWTHYRSREDLDGLLARHFESVTHHEDLLLEKRMNRIPLIRLFPPRPVKTWFTRGMAGLAVYAQKPNI